MINVRVDELIIKIEQTKAEIQRSTGMRQRDLKRNLGRLYKQMDAFRRIVAGK